MSQSPPAVSPVNSSALQVPITLQSPGSMVTVGAPGGPVIFSSYASLVVTALGGSASRGVTQTL